MDLMEILITGIIISIYMAIGFAFAPDENKNDEMDLTQNELKKALESGQLTEKELLDIVHSDECSIIIILTIIGYCQIPTVVKVAKEKGKKMRRELLKILEDASF